MPDYVLRGAVRAEDGAIGPLLVEKTITAANTREAIKIAGDCDIAGEDSGVNALWLTDADGNLLWSLRLADQR